MRVSEAESFNALAWSRDDLGSTLSQLSRDRHRPTWPSNLPPSPHFSRPRSQRCRGGQPDHRGPTRLLGPVDAGDAVVVLQPEQGSGCQLSLSGDDASPLRHPVMEIPLLKLVITA